MSINARIEMKSLARKLADVAQPFFTHGGRAETENTGATRLITDDDAGHNQIKAP
jgi:hypothetical protein